MSLEIEGFKGFTKLRTIDFKGRHVFLLGKNGNGKSSIVEAIRWGFIGSINRPNEVVTNQGYIGGPCRVTLTFLHDDGTWKLKRTLMRGVIGGGSEPVLTDDKGRVRNIRDVIPSLESADTGEGTHILYSSQSAPLRRQPTDLKPFNRTVLNHIGLLRVQSFGTHLDNFLSDQEDIENNFAREIQVRQDKLESYLMGLMDERRRILQTPPWGNDPVPTIDESEGRARSLIKEITGNAPERGATLSALIEDAKESLVERRSNDLDTLSERLREIEDRIDSYRNAVKCIQNVDEQTAKVNAVQTELDTKLNGVSYDELQRCVMEAERSLGDLEIKRQIVNKAIELLGREADGDEVLCPVCADGHNLNELTYRLRSQAGHLRETHDGSHTRSNQLESQFKQVDDLKRRVSTEEEVLDGLKRESQELALLVHTDDRGSLVGDGRLDHISELQDESDGISQQIDGSQAKLNDWTRRLSDLEVERRIHDIERMRVDLERRTTEFERIKTFYDELVSFGRSVEKIRQAVHRSFMESLSERLPDVLEPLSRSFADLTGHPYFDKLGFDRNRLPDLELQVSSSQDTTGRLYPTSVLNGQAESALELVPQFTFGRIEGNTQMHLMMLDDPTRAFDEDHIAKLVERLAEQGKHVQLVVASQESERFRNLLPNYFEEDSYMVITPTNWTYEHGPDLSIDHPK